MKLLAALALVLAASTAGATKLLLINNSQSVPGTTSMFTYDTETKALSKKPIFSKTGITGGSDSFISGTVTCGNTFFGIWADAPMAAGVAMIDLATGNNTYTTTTGSTLTIYHSLACDPKSTAASPSVIGVATQPSGGKMVNIKLFRLDMTTGASTAIGSFPAGVNFDGYDNMFAFTNDGTQLYAAFPNNSFNQKVTTGSLYVMDTATGKIVEGSNGMPYDLYPTGKDTFRAGFVHTQTNVIHLCDVDKSGKDVEVSNCAKTPGLASESTRSPACADGEIYATHQYGNAGASQPLFKIDVATGASTQLVDLSTVIQDVYTVNVACAPTSELTVSASWLTSKGAAAATHYEDPSAGGCQSGVPHGHPRRHDREPGVRARDAGREQAEPLCADLRVQLEVPGQGQLQAGAGRHRHLHVRLVNVRAQANQKPGAQHVHAHATVSLASRHVARVQRCWLAFLGQPQAKRSYQVFLVFSHRKYLFLNHLLLLL